MNTGIDALSRAGAARGVATGNTLADATKLGTGLAQQDWGNYVQRLQPFIGSTQGAAVGQGNIRMGLGDQLSRSYGSQGDLGFRAESGIGDANAAAALDRNRASGQIWNTIGGAARLAAGMM